MCPLALLPLPKLYAIKLISIGSNYVVAAYVWRLLQREFPKNQRAWVAITIFLFLPTVVMNGALWAQCDVIYVGGFVASLSYLLENRPRAALIAFGLSCSLKPQAIFWCPLLAGLFVSGRLPWKWIWIPGAVYAACGIPAMLAGRPVLDVLAYWGRVENTPGLTLGATNWYQWVFEQYPEIFWWPGVVLTLGATAVFVLWMNENRAKQSDQNRWLVSLALLSVLFPPFLLPGMHERYFFAADVLSVIYAFYVAGGWRVTALVQTASAFTYLPYLFSKEVIPRTLLPLAIVVALVLVVRDLVQGSKTDGKQEKRA